MCKHKTQNTINANNYVLHRGQKIRDRGQFKKKTIQKSRNEEENK